LAKVSSFEKKKKKKKTGRVLNSWHQDPDTFHLRQHAMLLILFFLCETVYYLPNALGLKWLVFIIFSLKIDRSYFFWRRYPKDLNYKLVNQGRFKKNKVYQWTN
jgi:hypothetical protein